MNLNNFTIKSQEAVQQAVTLATMNGQQAVENGHILKSILEVDENVAPFILKKLNIKADVFEKTLDSILKSYPKVEGGQPFLSTAANQTVAKATSFLKEFKDEFVSIEHLLLGILASGDSVAGMMKDMGFTEKDLKAAIKELRKGASVTSQ